MLYQHVASMISCHMDLEPVMRLGRTIFLGHKASVTSRLSQFSILRFAQLPSPIGRMSSQATCTPTTSAKIQPQAYSSI